MEEERLSALLRALWRALVRATRSAEHLPALPEAQAELLHHLVAAGPSSPAQLAADMHLARPTISNLIRDLTAAGLVDRRPSAQDGRSVQLQVTGKARKVLDAFSRGRVEVLRAAMSELSDEERRHVEKALPALTKLRRSLETRMSQPEKDAPP